MLKYSSSIAVLISLSISCLTGCAGTAASGGGEQVVSLNGSWQFTADKNNEGTNANWFEKEFSRSSWQQVQVPHTWQVMEGLERYTGYAWYARTIKLDCPVQDKILKLEFDAVNRDASVWVNGKLLGEHKGSGYTPFQFYCPCCRCRKWQYGNCSASDEQLSREALPYEKSYDWTTDGGIIRRVRLRILPGRISNGY